MKCALLIDVELKKLLVEIESEARHETDWAKIESCDMFQSESYCGGFDATEMEFCFSYDDGENEFWFQFPLSKVRSLIDDPQATLVMQKTIR